MMDFLLYVKKAASLSFYLEQIRLKDINLGSRINLALTTIPASEE